MRIAPRTLVVLVLLGVATGASADEPSAVLATVQSSLETAGKQIRQFAFDGDPETYFESKENPHATDQFTLVLDKPVAVTRVKVTTGKPDGTDKLEAGVLQTSVDGKKFTEVAKFVGGSANFDSKDQKVLAVRVQPTSDLSSPLVIREIVVESPQPVATFRYPIEFKVDVTDAPEMKEWADKVAVLCEAWYPRLNDQLKSDGFKPATQITMTMKNSYKGVAEASGTRITGSVKFFKARPDDLGAMIHETCHVIQRYRARGNPSWLVEGVADYVRFFIYEPGNAGPVNPLQAHYNDSYRTSASFLAYVSDKYDKSLVLKLNKLMREGKYKEEAFKNLTGKTVQELGEEWLESLKTK